MIFRWLLADRVDIVILHRHAFFEEIIESFDVNYRLLAVYPENGVYYINTRVISKLLKSCLFNSKGILKGNRRQFAKFILKTYYRAVIEELNPKLVITYIDNSSLYQELVTTDISRRYVAIQNSVRNEYNFKYSLAKKLEHDVYFCFGEQVKDVFLNNGNNANQFVYSGGTLMSSLEFSKFLDQEIAEADKFDFCIVSQWIERNFSEENPPHSDVGQSIRDATSSMLAMVNENKFFHGKKVAVCLRSSSQGEKKYFKEKLKNIINVQFVNNSYLGISCAKLTIGVSSTLLIEALAAHRRVLWCNPHAHAYHNIVDHELFFVNSTDCFVMGEKCSRLIEFTNEEYSIVSHSVRSYVGAFDRNNPPVERLRHLLTSLLE